MKLSITTLQKETKHENMKGKMFLKVQESIKICEKALKNNQENVEIIYNLGKCYLESEDYTKLQRITDVLRRKEPKLAPLYVLDGHGFLKQGYLIDAYKCFVKALSMTESFDLFLAYGMGVLYENMEFYSSAIEWYSKILRSDIELFKFIEIVYRVGVCLKKEDKLEESLNIFQTLLNLTNCKVLICDLKIQMAQIYEKLNNDDKCIEILNDLQTVYNKKNLLFKSFAWIYFKHKQFKKIKDLETKEEGQDPYVLYLIARTYIIEKNFDKATELLDKCINFDQDLFMAHNTLGIISFKNQQLDKAIVCFKRAISIRPTLVEASENLKAVGSASKSNSVKLKLKETVPDLSKTKYLDSQVIYGEILINPTITEINLIKEINCPN